MNETPLADLVVRDPNAKYVIPLKDYSNLEELYLNLKKAVREYLKYPSIDGNMNRQELRKKLEKLSA